MRKSALAARVGRVRRRMWVIGGSAAIGWAVCCALLVLGASVWLDLVWDLPPGWRVGLLAATAVIALATIVRLARLAVAGASAAAVARRIDNAGATGGIILSGWELERRPSAKKDPLLTAALADLAVARAAAAADGVPVAEAAPAGPLTRPAVAALLSLLAGAAVILCFPALARTEWRRFMSPWSDVPAYSRNSFHVEPGSAEVLYGDELAVWATVDGPPVERVQLVLDSASGEEVVPMFVDADGRWQTSLTRIIEPSTYYVRAHRARSERYRIRVVTIPRIEQVRVRIAPPEYTGLAPYRGAVPKDGIAGLPKTRVSLHVRSNRPLAGGTIALRGETETTEILMEPSQEGEHEVVGEFAIEEDAKLLVAVTDRQGQTSRETYEASVHLLSDEAPFLRVIEPRAQSLATPTANLPVVLSAEDDYGLSSVKLYRSLNDSRALPSEIPLPKRVSRRVYEPIYLPLGRYGLRPGDEIKLFGRAEDNDPSGAKGSESHVVLVRIISQEDFDRMTVVRKGLATLTSKYREARRRLEALAAEMESLRDELAEATPGSAASEAMQKRLKTLQRRFEEETEALHRLSAGLLPFDLDRHLTGELKRSAEISEEIAEALRNLAEEQATRNADLAAQLSELLERLNERRGEFDRQALAPLQWLEGIFPLVADQSRFVTLVLRQMDLAERLASLKGLDTVDPSAKARMRDLEDEQRRIRNDLAALLEEIEDHAESLPEDDRLDKLHETAMRFAEEVRESGVFEAMQGAETALAGFSGTAGHEKAREAADILQKFLSLCENGGGPAALAGQCLGFQPSLSQGLGDTIGQLLSEMGLGSGSGGGSGAGAGGGFSAARSGNLGLYGGSPGMTGGGSGQIGESRLSAGGRAGAGAAETYERANPDRDSLTDVPAVDEASGVGAEPVPARYRRKVGQYFRRLADELGTR